MRRHRFCRKQAPTIPTVGGKLDLAAASRCSTSPPSPVAVTCALSMFVALSNVNTTLRCAGTTPSASVAARLSTLSRRAARRSTGAAFARSCSPYSAAATSIAAALDRRLAATARSVASGAGASSSSSISRSHNEVTQ